MKKINRLSIVLIFVAFCGCTSAHNPSALMNDYVSGIEMAKENAVKLATISEFKTCFIRSALGNHIKQLLYEMVVTLDEIDQLLKEIGIDYKLMTDCQKGQILGLWTRLVALGILEIVEEINPGVLVGLL